MERREKKVSGVVVALAGLLVPGLGYWLLGQRRRSLIAGGGIILLFVLGVLIAGVRVINLPGYEDGYLKYYEVHTGGYGYPTTQPVIRSAPANDGTRLTVLTRRVGDQTREERVTYDVIHTEPQILAAPVSVISDNLWFLGQMLAPTLTGVTGYLSNQAARMGVDRSYARLADVGALYTAVAGMLNLMVVVDASARAGRTGREDRRR